ncbi:ribonuclease H1-like isoform X2 [Venturia canescens]|uniref:ribonuclease H1-like isoform X1 n=1 Tax=Venturia canescens TaxID=32260 RepID=UPI001C9D465A|nr:ribonuclease H1-like isoform X1 [Venturia canescens]XP_043273301.1 ribonuclease H1-like isoform X2 [Venturia canescens]
MPRYQQSRDGFVHIYTDGACSRNGAPDAKAGIGVFFADGSPLNVSEPVVGRATNNTAEIQAVTRAAEVACEEGINKILIHTDSAFVMNCINKWMDRWKRRDWITTSGRKVVNKGDLLDMEQALKNFGAVKWKHVPGHGDSYGNRRADELAREGARRYQPPHYFCGLAMLNY